MSRRVYGSDTHCADAVIWKTPQALRKHIHLVRHELPPSLAQHCLGFRRSMPSFRQQEVAMGVTIAQGPLATRREVPGTLSDKPVGATSSNAKSERSKRAEATCRVTAVQHAFLLDYLE